MIISNHWDSFFYHIAQDCASMSKCLSRQIGAVVVRDKRVISTGYNGPPSGVPHCNVRRKHDKSLDDKLTAAGNSDKVLTKCPRQILGAGSGELLDLCPATHAEVNAIVNAAFLGVSVVGSTLFMTCGVPCRNCLATIINAGISEIVCTSLEWYDKTSVFVLRKSDLLVRLYDQSPIDKFRLGK